MATLLPRRFASLGVTACGAVLFLFGGATPCAVPVAESPAYAAESSYFSPSIASSADASVLNYESRFSRVEAVPADLAETIRSLAALCPGDPAIVISSPAGGWEMTFQADRTLPAASVIKFPIMFALHRMAARNKVDLDTPVALIASDRTRGSGVLKRSSLRGRIYPLRSLVSLMMRESDNIATNAIIRFVGLDAIQNEFEKMGLEETRLDHEILRSFPDNPASPGEIATLLEDLSTHREREASRRHGITTDQLIEMRRIMEGTSNTRRLARYLPTEARLAHKTGTLNGVIHDAGLITSDNRELVVAAFVVDARSHSAAEQWIGRVASAALELATP